MARGRGDLTAVRRMGAACFAFLWVPACAGMTGESAGMTGVGGNDGLFTLTLTLSHRGRGDVPDPSPLGPRLRGNDQGAARSTSWFKENAPASPRGRFALPSPPVGWECQGQGLRSSLTGRRRHRSRPRFLDRFRFRCHPRGCRTCFGSHPRCRHACCCPSSRQL